MKTKDLKPVVLASSVINIEKPTTTVMTGTHLASKRAVPQSGLADHRDLMAAGAGP